jgi:hypothetical protein
MAKRIFDIIPPNEVDIAQNEFEGNFDLTKTRESDISIDVKRPKSKKGFPVVRWLVVLLVIGGAVGAYLVPAKAEIKIYPKTEAIQISDTIYVDPNVTAVNADAKTIPGTVFTEEKQYSQTYNSTGNSENSTKATGTIRVYNKATPAEPLTLKTGTHFLSTPKGLSYHSLTAINIPAATVSGSKVTPGYVDIQVEADESGTDYNLSSATFSLPKLNGTAYYSTTWAETQTEIKGGTSSTIKIVTKKDIDSGKDNFETQSIADATGLLKGKITTDFVIFDESITQAVNNLTVSAKANDTTPSFDIKGDVSLSAIGYKVEDLKAIGETLLLNSNADAVKQIVPNSQNCSVAGYKQDAENNRLELQITCNAKTYWLPDSDFLAKALGGKNKDYSASILKSFSEVNKAEVNIWPFWKINMPQSSQSIDIKVNFE